MSNEIKLETGELLKGGLAEFSRWGFRGWLWLLVFYIIALSFAIISDDQQQLSELNERLSPVTVYAAEYWWAILALNFLTLAILVSIATRSIMLMQMPNSQPWRLVLAATAAYLISLVPITIGFAFLLLPGIYLLARWYLLVPFIVDGKSSLADSFGKSWALTSASAGAIMTSYLIIFLPLVIFSGLEFRMGGNAITAIGISSMWSAGSSVYGVALSVFAYRRLAGEYDDIREVFS